LVAGGVRLFIWYCCSFFRTVNALNDSIGIGTYELYKLGESWFISKVVD